MSQKRNERLEKAPRLVGNCLVYVYQFLTSNSNFKTTSNIQNFLFTYPLRKTNLSPTIPKTESPKKLQKGQKRRYVILA